VLCTIIVTYNRKNDLLKCLKSLLHGSTLPDKIYVIDNASTDQTQSFIEDHFANEIRLGIIDYRVLPENIGGAGGFHCGLQIALQSEYDYFWLMDDDAEPDSHALSSLMEAIKSTNNSQDKCFVSLATDKTKERLSWGTGISLDNKTVIVEYLKDVPEDRQLKAPWAPFLGFLVSRKIIERIGLPRREYFIWGDDVEYSSRVWRSGFEILYIRDSIIYHPVLEKISVRFLGRDVVLINADDWKQYYGMRNDIYTLSRQRQYSSMLKRIVFYFLVWKVRGMRRDTLHYYIKGLYHGIIGRLGKYTG